MCGLMKAYGPRVTQTVLFSSAPTASTGRDSNGSRTGNGAYPRERRMGTSPPAATRRHRVVAPDVDRPVVEQECVGDVREPAEGVGIVRRDGLLAPVPAGHDQRRESPVWRVEQQVMQRGVRQHHAEPPQARGHRGRDSAGRARPKEHDGPRRRGEQPPLLGRDHAQPLGVPQIGHHDGQRLALAPLALPQPAHRRFAGRVAREVKAADALDGHDAPAREQSAGFVQRVPGQRVTAGVQQTQARPAIGAGIGLRMEPPIVRDPRTPPGSGDT